jgi:cell division protein FtsB
MKAPFARLAYLMAVLLVAGYAVITLRGPRGIRAFLDKQSQIQQLEAHNAKLAKEIERKREHINRLSANPAEQELEIRERLKLVHPKDKVFIIEPPAN